MQVRMHLAILLQPQLEPQGYMELRLHGSSKKSQVSTRLRDSSAKPSQVWLGSSDPSDIESPTLVDMSPKLVSRSHASNSASLSSSTSAQRFLDRLHGRSMLSNGAQAEAPVHVDADDKVSAASRSCRFFCMARARRRRVKPETWCFLLFCGFDDFQKMTVSSLPTVVFVF